MTTTPATIAKGPRKQIRRKASALTASHSGAYLLTHGRLLLRVTRNEVTARYAASLFGAAWVFLTPLLILGIYAAVYLVIFPFQPPELSDREYVLYILAGLAPFLTLAEALTMGAGSVIANRAVLSNVVFPIDLVAPKTVLIAQGPITVGSAMLFVGTALTGGLSWTALFVPFVWLGFVTTLIGVVWVISLLNIVFRDLQHVVAAGLMILLIASPFAYTPSMVPAKLEWLILLNPFAYFVIAFQKLWVLGELPSVVETVVLVGLAGGVFAFGGWFFVRAKRSLIDYV